MRRAMGTMVVGMLAGGLLACAAPGEQGDGVELSKQDARQLSKLDWWDDFCEAFGWYGDGVCDDFCPQPDPDCQDADHPTDHRPYCGATGTSNEGWYWGDSGALIKLELCASKPEPSCGAIGSRSEGWFADGFITWDSCHQTVGLALYGEPCAGDSGLACHVVPDLGADGLYCMGDTDSRAGVCRRMGQCEVANHCVEPDNGWVHVMCAGRATCEAGECGWVCQYEPPPPTDHRPYCGQQGTAYEGWYWGDSGEPIARASCQGASAPVCDAMGTRSEGWYVDGSLLTYDFCHRTVRKALDGEACGPSIGFSCLDQSYCQGLPAEGTRGGTGTCMRDGSCVEVADCDAEGNLWHRMMCMGYLVCEQGQCGVHCGPAPQPGPWSWTTYLVRDVESAHPYSNNLVQSWALAHPGAQQIKVHFSRVDVERRYDRLVVHAPGAEAQGQILDGQHSELWSEPVAGEQLALTLRTDYSVTPWGFAVDQISVYEQLPPGMCNTSDDCPGSQYCVPHQCINAYAPCHGSCQGGGACDDGSALSCRRMVPMCPEGTVLAVQSGCYACVDPATCQPPAQGLERRFTSDEPLAIPDNTPAGVISELDVDEVFDCVPELRLDLRVRHPWAGDLVIALEDPTGHSTVLWQRQGGSQDDVILTDHVLTGVLPQGRANGIWKLHLSDHAARDLGQLESWSLLLACR